ncbi:hypothetical protein ILYODFUR_018839 [Ilyodon furcidens]|uniref:Uncharacterized protein n=1 Tax=Ilyodon furcidens TaxID=33524 RepID=A0ABV0SZX6_9TELE
MDQLAEEASAVNGSVRPDMSWFQPPLASSPHNVKDSFRYKDRTEKVKSQRKSSRDVQKVVRTTSGPLHQEVILLETIYSIFFFPPLLLEKCRSINSTCL